MKLQRTLLVILLICLALPSLAAAEQDDFAVEPLEDGGVAITRYRGKVHKLTVPDTLDGQAVTAVRAGAFRDLDVLESVALPDSIVTVEDGAFSRCERLASIYVSPNHPALAAIDGVLFSKSDKRLICYPPAKEGGEYAVPQGIRAIGGGAFEGAARLKSVSIPDSVTEIGVNPFAGCAWLSGLAVAEGNAALSVIDGALYDTAARRLVCYPADLNAAEYAVAEGTLVIGDYTFYGCSALRRVSMPDSVTAIGGYAFSQSAHLEAAALGQGVTEIGDYAFYGCPALDDLTLPDGLESIGERAFSRCDALESVRIPERVSNLGNTAFSYCHALKSAEIAAPVETLPRYLFFDCTALESVILPDGLTALDWNVFRSCTALRDVTLPDSLTTIGDNAFKGCESLSALTLPDGLTTICEGAFAECAALTALTLPESVCEIGKDAFADCPVTLTVERDSPAAQYAESARVPYTYPNANDWLND